MRSRHSNYSHRVAFRDCSPNPFHIVGRYAGWFWPLWSSPPHPHIGTLLHALLLQHNCHLCMHLTLNVIHSSFSYKQRKWLLSKWYLNVNLKLAHDPGAMYSLFPLLQIEKYARYSGTTRSLGPNEISLTSVVRNDIWSIFRIIL